MPHLQFTIRSLLIAILVVAAFFAGIHFEQRRTQPDSSVSHGITTVEVRLVEATKLRRDKNEQLLDAVRLQIERTTPFKVASTSKADSELLCTVSVAGETQQIKVEWIDRHGANLKPPVSIPLDDLSAGAINYAANGIANFVEPAW